jgi:mono/diheme cytochrome c family protein
MKRASRLLLPLVCAAAALPAASTADPRPTYAKDVAPILFRRCVECHRAGDPAPMPLIAFKEVRPWAKAIREKVLERSMPPWLADAAYGHFSNDRRLSRKEIDTIVAWVDAGALPGEDRDLPPTPKFEEGWTIGKPDVVVSLPDEVAVPAEGVVPYRYITVPTNFGEDKWVQSAEIRPGNRAVVHHVIVFTEDPAPGDRAGTQSKGEGGRDFASAKLAGFAPGEQPKVYPPGTAKLVRAGAKLLFQLHYTPNGKPATDRTSIGLIFARGPIAQPALTGTATNYRFAIPPGDPNYEVRSSWTAPQEVRIVDLMPHMHVRGKDFKYTVVYPDGHSEIVLRVPKYDFNWQLVYRMQEPLSLPKGARLDCVAHFDNSPNNSANPDPLKEVRWGPQTWEEMMIGWFDYTLDGPRLTAQR